MIKYLPIIFLDLNLSNLTTAANIEQLSYSLTRPTIHALGEDLFIQFPSRLGILQQVSDGQLETEPHILMSVIKGLYSMKPGKIISICSCRGWIKIHSSV